MDILKLLESRRNKQAKPVHRVRRNDQPVHGLPIDEFGRLIPVQFLKQGDEELAEQLLEQQDLLEEFGENYDNRHDDMAREVYRRYGSHNINVRHFTGPDTVSYFHKKTGFPVASYRPDKHSGSIYPEHEFHAKERIDAPIKEDTYPDSPRKRINGGTNNVNSRPASGLSPKDGGEKKSANMKPVKPVSNIINSGDDAGELHKTLSERLKDLLETRRVEIASSLFEKVGWLGDDYDKSASTPAKSNPQPRKSSNIEYVDAGGSDKRGRASPWVMKHDYTSQSSGKKYRIAFNQKTEKWGCSCPNWIYKRQHTGDDCKHIEDFKSQKGITESNISEMYTHINFKSKKHLKDAIAQGQHVSIFQPGPFGGKEPRDGTVSLEGPHYPAPHSWYGTATLKDGRIVKVK